MKKLFYVLLLGITIGSNFLILATCQCGIETEIPKHINQLLVTFGKKYKDDPIVQAILKHDIKVIEKSTVDPKQRLHIEMQENKQEKVVCKCDYIGLTFGTLMRNPRRPTEKEINETFKIIRILLQKGVNPEGSYAWIPYSYNKKGRWVIDRRVGITKGTNKELVQGFAKNPAGTQLTTIS